MWIGLFLIGFFAQKLCLRSGNKLVRLIPVLKAFAELALMVVILIMGRSGNWLPILLMVFFAAGLLGNGACWLVYGIFHSHKKEKPEESVGEV